MFIKFRDALLRRVWNKKLAHRSIFKRFYYRSIKLICISTYNFFKHHLVLRASALTYFSLMAIVPFFALIFAIAKKIGYQENVEKELLERFNEQKEIISKVVEFAKNLIVEARGGLIAFVGIVFLFWSLIKLFSNLESSLNEVWQIKKPRNFKRSLSNYLALMFVIPIFVVAIVALKIYIMTFLSNDYIAEDLIIFSWSSIPYLLILVLFTFVYVFIPKIKVKIKYAFISAIISSALYQIIQSIYVNFQVGITKLNAIYGSFAALPLFLIWLQISWLIFLFGAELCSAFQNVKRIKLSDLQKK